MSECKHERITCVGHVNIWRCDDCGHEEPNIEELRTNVVKAEQERDELQAQVAVLRGALELYGDLRDFTSLAVDALQRGDEKNAAKYFDKKRTIAGVMKNALATTPSEAAERVQKLVEALEDCRNLISKTEFPTVAEQADKAISEWRRDKCS